LNAGVWAAALGGTGFLCGFVGPILLNPGANQGPLLGLFITGPGGAALGALLGSLLGGRPNSPRLLLYTCATAAVGILLFCLPEPEYHADLVELEVLKCEPPSAHKAEAVERWEKALASNSWVKPPEGWRETVDRAKGPGSVLTTAVKRRREIFRARKPWNNGRLVSRGWIPGPGARMQRPGIYYAQSSCSAWPTGTKGAYLTAVEPSEGYPPSAVSRFLRLVLLVAPGEAEKPFLP
jgi:uncharacterized membrane protein YeaQ/YmgE (transglycosylase-associated protein family)